MSPMLTELALSRRRHWGLSIVIRRMNGGIFKVQDWCVLAIITLPAPIPYTISQSNRSRMQFNQDSDFKVVWGQNTTEVSLPGITLCNTRGKFIRRCIQY